MTPVPTASQRNDGLDALRGLFLVLMTVTHLPTAFSSAFGQPLGYASAAEGFVLLSAFLAGRVYLRRGLLAGPAAMRRALWSRAATVYRHHLGLLAFGASAILAVGVLRGEGAITSMFTVYLQSPLDAVIAALLLFYQPALFDILPMYVLFLLLTPLVLNHALRRGWALPLALSITVWAVAWSGLRGGWHAGVTALTGWSIPIHATGAFNPFAWQLLWVVGLWLGTAGLQNAPQRLAASPRLLGLLGLLALSFVAWRHIGGYAPFGSGDTASLLNRAVAKWNLGPLRLVNVFALTVLVAAAGPWLMRRGLPAPLVCLGRSSLWVFSAHLVCCLVALAGFGAAARREPNLLLDLGLLATSLLVIYAVARVHQAWTARPVAPLPVPAGPTQPIAPPGTGG